MHEGPSSPARTPKALTLGLLLFLLMNALGVSGLLWLASPEPHKETVLKHSWELVRGVAGDDSWGTMYAALERVRERPDLPLYTQVFFLEQFRFQYPPSSLFALAAMQVAAPARLQIDDVYEGPWPPINTVVAWVFIVLTAATVAALLEDRLRSAQPNVHWHQQMWLRAVVVFGLVLTFYPIVKAFTLGQIQVWINALFAVGLLAWVKRWKISAGILVGIISLIKPHYGLVLIWALLRREFVLAVACAATVVLGLGASVAVYGMANHFDYVRVVSFLSQHGETYYPNQSVNGLLNRLMSIRDPQAYVSLDLPAGQFPPFTPWIYAITLASSIAILIGALLPKRGSGDADRVADFAIIALSCTMASPIAWEHHYGITLPMYAILLASSLSDRIRLVPIGVSYVLVSTFVQVANLLAGGPLNVLQSTLFLGALVLLWLLYWQATASPATEARGASRIVTDRTQQPEFSA